MNVEDLFQNERLYLVEKKLKGPYTSFMLKVDNPRKFMNIYCLRNTIRYIHNEYFDQCHAIFSDNLGTSVPTVR